MRFCASPGGLSPDLLRNAAAEAGAFTAADQAWLVVDLNDRFLSIHCLKSGSYAIRLPSVSKVIDAFTGKVVARKTDSLTGNLTAQRTVWYLLEDPE